MTLNDSRKEVLQCIDDAITQGVSLSRICDFIDISIRTIQRWKANTSGDKRKGSARKVHNRLNEEETTKILEVVNKPEYRGLPAAQIVAILAEKGEYVASERTIYRVLKNAHQLTHRGSYRKPVKRNRQTIVANRPLKVLSWDITYLKTNIKGKYFYLYLVMDVWSRRIVTWEIHDMESSELSAAMMERLSKQINLHGVLLHADNGGPMKGSTMLSKLYELDVLASFSRPRVSEDNPYSESLFKTMKYRPGYPKFFSTIDDARIWVAEFVNWYNNAHLHSGIGYVTPEQRHTGADKLIFEKRSETFRKAKEAHPERWSGKAKEWVHLGEVLLGRKKA